MKIRATMAALALGVALSATFAATPAFAFVFAVIAIDSRADQANPRQVIMAKSHTNAVRFRTYGNTKST